MCLKFCFWMLASRFLCNKSMQMSQLWSLSQSFLVASGWCATYRSSQCTDKSMADISKVLLHARFKSSIKRVFLTGCTWDLHLNIQHVWSMAVGCNHVIILKSFQIPRNLLFAIHPQGAVCTWPHPYMSTHTQLYTDMLTLFVDVFFCKI